MQPGDHVCQSAGLQIIINEVHQDNMTSRRIEAHVDAPPPPIPALPPTDTNNSSSSSFSLKASSGAEPLQSMGKRR